MFNYIYSIWNIIFDKYSTIRIQNNYYKIKHLSILFVIAYSFPYNFKNLLKYLKSKLQLPLLNDHIVFKNKK
jgi:hypothetical protein